MLLVAGSKERRPRHQWDQYDTPPEFAAAALSLVTGTPRLILDPGAGTGVFGAEARKLWPRAFIVGVEVQDPLTKPVDYDDWHTGDFGEWCRNGEARPGFDLIAGNPAWGDAERWVRLSLTQAGFGGQVIFLLPYQFSQSVERASGLFREHPPEFIAVCDRRPVFYGAGTGGSAVAFFGWRNGFRGRTEHRWVCIEKPRKRRGDHSAP